MQGTKEQSGPRVIAETIASEDRNSLYVTSTFFRQIPENMSQIRKQPELAAALVEPKIRLHSSLFPPVLAAP